jgi:hypothetical protein
VVGGCTGQCVEYHSFDLLFPTFKVVKNVNLFIKFSACCKLKT